MAGVSTRFGWVVAWLYFHGVLGGIAALILLPSAPAYGLPYLLVALASIAAATGLRRDASWSRPLAIGIESLSVAGCVLAAIFGGEGVALMQGAISAAAVITLVRARRAAMVTS